MQHFWTLVFIVVLFCKPYFWSAWRYRTLGTNTLLLSARIIFSFMFKILSGSEGLENRSGRWNADCVHCVLSLSCAVVVCTASTRCIIKHHHPGEQELSSCAVFLSTSAAQTSVKSSRLISCLLTIDGPLYERTHCFFNERGSEMQNVKITMGWLYNLSSVKH